MAAVRRAAAILLAGAMLLGAVWILAAPAGPPLYDGVGFPDEPYRYVAPPAGAKPTKPPTSVRLGVDVHSGHSVAAEISTGEQTAQAAAFVGTGGLRTKPAAKFVTVTLGPTGPPTPPADGTIPGNAYTVTASSTAGAVSVSTARSALTVLLRIPAATSKVVAIEVLTGKGWQQLNTFQTGTDIYQAALPVLGTVAAVIVNDPTKTVRYINAPATARSGSAIAVGPLLAGLVLLLLVALVLGVRVTRGRRAGTTHPTRPSPP